MVKFSIFLIFLTFISIRSQTYPVSYYDNQLFEIASNLIGKEAEISQAIKEFLVSLKSSSNQLKNYTRLQGSINNTIALLTTMQFINNHPIYGNVSICSDINMKITQLEWNARKYTKVITEASSNFTSLQTCMVFVRTFFNLNKVTDTEGILNQGSYIGRMFLDYINLLSNSIVAEGTINGNLKFYKKSYCSCPVTSSSDPRPSRLESNFAFIDGFLAADEASIVKKAKEAQSKVNNSISLIRNAPLRANLQKALEQLTKIVTASDYFTRTTNTSCMETTRRQEYALNAQKNYTNRVILVSNNFSFLASYAINCNATFLAINTTLNATQRETVRGALVDMGDLLVWLRWYIQMLNWAVGRAAWIYSEVRGSADSFCGCRSGNSITSTSTSVTSESSTTSEETTEEITTEVTQEGILTTSTSNPSTSSTTSVTTPSSTSTSSSTSTTSTSTTPSTSTTSTTPSTSTTSTTPSTSTTSTTPSTSTTSTTTSTSTTTVSTTTSTTVAPEPCGMFVRYNYIDTPDDPAIRGFSAGDYFGGGQAYVGLGSDTSCSYYTNVPARIQIPPESPGAYIPCNSYEVDIDTPYFLVNHPSLKWVNINDPNYSKNKILALVEKTTGIQFTFGRVNLTLSGKGTFTTLGWAVQTNTGPAIFFMNGVGPTDSVFVRANAADVGYEVLSC